MKTLQLFSDEALERGKQMSAEEIVRFLDEFRRRYGSTDAEVARQLEIPTSPATVEIKSK